MTRPEGCVSDLALDAWSSDELEQPALERAIAHVAVCERCSERRGLLDADRSQYYAQAPSFAARYAERAPRKRWWSVGGLVAAAAAAALLFSNTPATRLKGQPALGYFVKRGERVFPGDSGTEVHPGDLIRFTYSSERPRYLALLNRDSQKATVYLPATRVERGHEVALKFSVELDDTPGDESVHALFCPDTFELAPLLTMLDDTGRLSVPDSCQQSSLTLHKVPAQ
jgi:hypothetical protein